MKIQAPVSGIYRITNKVTGWAYIGESVNIPSRIAQHFTSLSNDEHHSLAMQADYDNHGAESFEYEILYKMNTKQKQRLRRVESNYIREHMKDGVMLYNGENNGSLHVKEKASHVAERRLRKKAEKDKKRREKLQRDRELAKRKSSGSLAGNKQGAHADKPGTGNGEKRVSKEPPTERPPLARVDEDRQRKESSRDNYKTLQRGRTDGHYGERDPHDALKFCDGVGHDFYCDHHDCGDHLIISIKEDDYADTLYLLQTYFSESIKERIVDDLLQEFDFMLSDNLGGRGDIIRERLKQDGFDSVTEFWLAIANGHAPYIIERDDS